ncbi:hypothetical protein LCGC14_2406680 [marine sediment metagenome]|uniref:Uncharacterized protein n=1 Tax=marine sediment metagenome TaxID=412755 RepID=A0A0F9CFT7_9ZZZZ
MVYFQYDKTLGVNLVSKGIPAFECAVCSEVEQCNTWGKDCLLMWLRELDAKVMGFK